MEDDLTNLVELLKSSELYKQAAPVYDDGCSIETEIPFQTLTGENSLYISLHQDGAHFIVLTNYRLFFTNNEGFCSIPLGLIDTVEQQNDCSIVVLCKDGRSIKLRLDSSEQCKVWHHRIFGAMKPSANFRDTFAFIHYAYSRDIPSQLNVRHGGVVGMTTELLTSEYFRMGFNTTGSWRITECNTKYSLCSSYPKLFIVPQSVTDSDLQQVAKFRSLGRVPAVVWRHKDNGCIIARSSQPMVGVLGWRCHEDEQCLLSLSRSCIINHSHISGGQDEKNGHIPALTTLLVFDLRSYTAALGNRAKGGGCEHPDYYSNCEICYKGLANIHSIRSSFCNLRNLLISKEQNRYLSLLESTQWLLYISQLLQTAIEVAVAVNDQSRPVLVHCSDGWDRTTQVVTLVQVLLDPFYRTVSGFQVLIEREWLGFGHKFSDRNGFGVDGEQSPIFLQWLDCVHQIMIQFPTSFQFNLNFLVKLSQHCFSQLYGTFLANCEQEREKEMIRTQTISVWSLLSKQKEYLNLLYKESTNKEVLYPSYYLQNLQLWKELYMTTPLIPYSLGSSTASLLATPTPVSASFAVNGSCGGYRNGKLSHNVAVTADGQSMDDERKRLELSTSSKMNHNLDTSILVSSVFNNIEVEESFRVLHDEEASLTAAQDLHVALETSQTTIQSQHGSSLSYSLYSQCDSRLRSLGTDGLSKDVDAVQERIRQIDEEYCVRLETLESKIKKLTLVLRTRCDSDKSATKESEDEEQTTLSSTEDASKSISPITKEWTYVDISDTNGVKWIPDHAATHCKLCGAEFWMGRRKHHCRNCGGVFCWQCSNYFTPVPHEQLFQNQRVCKSCFDKLGGFFKDRLNVSSISVNDN